MFKQGLNLCESVIGQNEADRQWQDGVFLSPACHERFLVDSDIPEMREFGFHMAGMAELKEEYWVERTTPETHTVLITIEGQGQLATEQGIESIVPHSMTVLPANRPFRFELAPLASTWKMIWILCKDIDSWQGWHERAKRVTNFEEAERTWSTVQLLHAEIGGRKTFRRFLLSELTRVLTRVEPSDYDTPTRVMAVYNVIESQLHLDWRVSQVARRCYLSEEQLNRVTLSLYGANPRSYLVKLRMTRAAALLDHTDWSIKMISSRLGYQDPNNFSHRFKKYHGVSPKHYRANKKEKGSL
ncbi:AraC family transcriptional regulator [Vibrio agarivorans]|uniref:AraC family transcriptional regulator n=1 Tax=Vibrio agarivorans TaxID=153622 RepID=UPI002231C01A|nr:AraC family transcriptional regulator [Vibrio agarivorans]